MGYIRGGLIGAAAVTVAVMSAPLAGPVLSSPDGDIVFSVLREGSPIGTHRVSFAQNGDTLEVRVDLSLEVKLGFIPLFHYRHASVEVWRGASLLSLYATTDDDGEKFVVYGEATAGGFVVDGSMGTFIAPADVYPTSYWSEHMIAHSTLLDTQRGRLISVSVAPVQDLSAVTDFREERRYRLSGDVAGEVGYSGTGAWRSLRFVAMGSEISYVRLPNDPVRTARRLNDD